ncbi:hypothetical protein ASF36_24540 [Methylobacterium sp. Leaf90]|nr:hypothetical protein ASF36_24540 [Methylobacterium sp. Leaf90]
MSRKRPKPEEIVAKLRQADVLVGQRTQLINAIRGHLAEYDQIAPKAPFHVERLIELIEDPASGIRLDWHLVLEDGEGHDAACIDWILCSTMAENSSGSAGAAWIDVDDKHAAGARSRAETCCLASRPPSLRRMLPEQMLLSTPRRMNRSDSASITSAALSLRATRIARHSRVNSSTTLSIRNLRPSRFAPRRIRRTRRDRDAPPATQGRNIQGVVF